jgi:hypothetical protein
MKGSPDPNLKGDSVNYSKTNTYPATEDSNRSSYSLLACGLWLHIGTIGAFGLAGVLHQMFNGEMQPLSALALAAGAGLVMVMSWRRAVAVLDVDDEADVDTASVSLPANAAIGDPVA